MIPRKHPKPRRPRSPRCSVRGCKRIARVVAPCECRHDPDYCASAPCAAATNVGGRWCLSHAKREADRLFSLAMRAGGQCERCGKREALQCSHFISRRYLWTRWVRLNAECLCVGCHKYLTERPIEARDRARELLGATVYDELEEQARRFVGPVDYAAVLATLAQEDMER